MLLYRLDRRKCYLMHGSLATRLRVLRAERGLTVRDVAGLSGVAKETISQIERGERHPYDRTLAKLAQAYDVHVEELIEEPVPLTGARSRSAEPLKESELRPETDALVDMDIDEFVNLLTTRSYDGLVDLQQQLMLLLRYRYSPRSFETWEEVHEYMESAEKQRGDRAGELLRKVVKENEARATAVIEGREKALTA